MLALALCHLVFTFSGRLVLWDGGICFDYSNSHSKSPDGTRGRAEHEERQLAEGRLLDSCLSDKDIVGPTTTRLSPTAVPIEA